MKFLPLTSYDIFFLFNEQEKFLDHPWAGKATVLASSSSHAQGYTKWKGEASLKILPLAQHFLVIKEKKKSACSACRGKEKQNFDQKSVAI